MLSCWVNRPVVGWYQRWPYAVRVDRAGHQVGGVQGVGGVRDGRDRPIRLLRAGSSTLLTTVPQPSCKKAKHRHHGDKKNNNQQNA